MNVVAGLSRLVGRASGMRPQLAAAPAAPPAGPPGDPPAVVVAGGGIAGACAAVVLAERGVPVVVCEAGSRLGGRLAAHPYRLPDGTMQWVDHGFHGFFRQYYNWRRILARAAGEDSRLHPLGSYPVISARWSAEEFGRLPPAPPLSILALALRSPSLRLRDLARAPREAGLTLLGFDPGETYARLDHCSAGDLLAALRLPERARAMLFNVFAHSFFNDAATMSAAELVAMFHFYFLANPEGLGMDAPHADYQTAIWRPLRRYLARQGARVLTSTPVAKLDRDPAGFWRVHTASGTLTAGQVVLAADARGAARILAGSPSAADGDPRLADVAARPRAGPPYAVARYWLDGDVSPQRAQFTSIGDPGVLDSVTLYHRFERGARTWHHRTGGAVIELHAYACPRGVPAPELGAAMLAELRALWPETRRLHPAASRCRTGDDAAGFPVGCHATTPGVRTAVPGLTLAGDWVAVPFPCALMERAAVTGILAANAILTGHGYPAEPVWSVPPRGLLAGRRAARPRAAAWPPAARTGGAA